MLGDGVATITDFTQGEDIMRILVNKQDFDNFEFTVHIRPRDIEPTNDNSYLEGKLISFLASHGDFVLLEGFRGTLGEDDFEIVYSPATDII